MKYYLETNALRALGYNIHEKQNILSESFTSIFAIFEIIKGIDISKDSDKRINIINNLTRTNLKIINLMPIEVIENVFLTKIDISESYAIIQELEKVINYCSTEYKKSNSYLQLVKKYEEGTKIFQEKMTKDNCIPKPQAETIELTLDDLFSDSKVSLELSEKISKLPKDTYPSEIFLLMIQDEYLLSFYDKLNIAKDISKDEIL